jgi:hypothetical protein
MGSSGVDDAMERALDRINPPATLGVTMRESGVPLEDIKDVLGHKDISTTQIYAEITPKVKKLATHKLNEYLKNNTKKLKNLSNPWCIDTRIYTAERFLKFLNLIRSRTQSAITPATTGVQ